MVRVCDAIMGAGKTSAAINYINSHPEKKFVYLTPYLTEAARIKASCQKARFVEPSNKIPRYHFSKAEHTKALIKKGCNVTSTHQAMSHYMDDIAEELHKRGYTVIIDETISVLSDAGNITKTDIAMACTCGYVEETEHGEYKRTEKPYESGRFTKVFKTLESKSLAYFANGRGDGADVYRWMLPTSIFDNVEDVILLTYMFEGSDMESFFKINNIQYEVIGIRYTGKNKYEFFDGVTQLPEYAGHIKDMIHIENSEKMNAIGKKPTALSNRWYTNASKEDIKLLSNHLYNYFNNRTTGKAKDRMCGTFGSHWNKIKGGGYSKANVPFCQRSSNQWSNKTVLAYPVNVYPNVSVKLFYAKKGFPIDEDQYALSIMIQWIWRSAIRKGKPISLYLPSKRMRDLLTGWMDDLAKQAEEQKKSLPEQSA